MYTKTVRASLALVIVIAFLGAVQPEPLGDVLVVFTATGIIPGTNLAIPAEFTLVAVAAALMLIMALVFRVYAKHRLFMERFLPEFKNNKEDPSFGALVPGLARAVAFGRIVKAHASTTLPRVYSWLRYPSYPVIAQAVTARKGTRNIALRADRWMTLGLDRASLRHGTLAAVSALHKLSDRVREYLARVTMF